MGTAGIVFAIIADKIGSTHLLGCFLAGVVATAWKQFPEIWEPMVEPILPWMTMAFFSCTVGFAVPVSALAAKVWGLLVASIMGPFMFRGAVKFAASVEAKAAPAE